MCRPSEGISSSRTLGILCRVIRAPAIAVVNEQGKLVGTVTPETLADQMLVHAPPQEAEGPCSVPARYCQCSFVSLTVTRI